MKDNAFSDNKEAVKKILQIHEMKYQKKGKGATKKVWGLKKNDFEKLKQLDLIESIMHQPIDREQVVSVSAFVFKLISNFLNNLFSIFLF